MSGLTSFFKAFLPRNEQADGGEAENTTNASSSSNADSSLEYHQSIAKVISDDASARTTVAEDDAHPPPDPKTRSYSEFRSQCNKDLRVFMERRMLPSDSQEEDNEEDYDDEDNYNDKENEEDYMVPDNDEVHVPFWNDDTTTLHESQPTTVAAAEQDLESTAAQSQQSSRKVRRKKIPHVDETMHIAKTLSALDLYAREFHLSLGIVEKVWPLRAVTRRDWKVSSRYEDDGPLGTLFKKVLSMEVTQLVRHDGDDGHDHHHPQVAAMAQAAFQEGKMISPRRLRIFFYNRYAARLATLLGKQHLSRVLISLSNIPAKCIVPLDATSASSRDLSWYDREGLAPYCLCIGDRSSMKLESDGVLEKLAFDEPNSKVTLACVANNDANHVVEVELTHDSVKGHGDEMGPNGEPSSLERAYQGWEQAQEKEKENREATNDSDEGQVAVVPPPSPPKEAQDEADEASGNRSRRAQTESDERDKKKARTEEKYHNLSELRSLFDARKAGTSSDSLRVSLFAVVLGFSSPASTKGLDWMMKVALVDETTPLPPTAAASSGESSNIADEMTTVVSTAAIIFCREKNQLPKILKAGDVLRLHRVVMNEWKEEIQLIGRRFSSFVVVRPQNADSADPDDEWDVLPTARSGTQFGKRDTERAAALWQWARGRFANYPTIHQPSSKLTLALLTLPEQTNVTEERTGDLTVMVSAILPVPPALRTTGTPPGFLRVWDGTGAPESDPSPRTLASAGAAESIENGDPPSEALQAIAKAIGDIKSSDEGKDAASLKPPECLCGRVANVAVWEEPCWELITEALQVGSFIRLRNVHEGRMNNGLRCLMISSKSGLTPLPNDTYEIRELLQNHQERVSRKHPFNPKSGVLPLDEDNGDIAEPASDAVMTDIADTPGVATSPQNGFASIAQCISEPAPRSFKVKFHITGTMGWSQNGENRLSSLCIAGPEGKGYQFQFAVNINDETAAIDAFVSDAVGGALLQLEADEAMEMASSDADAVIKEITNEAKTYKGEIRSTEAHGARFFVLISVAPVYNT